MTQESQAEAFKMEPNYVWMLQSYPICTTEEFQFVSYLEEGKDKDKI